MGTEWATERWKYERAEGAATAHEVMTVDTDTHIGYVGTAEIAAHICEIHNRTFGDGQDPPAPIMLETARQWLEANLSHRRVAVNQPRGHLPMDLQARQYAPMQFRRALIALVEDEVHRRVTEYAAREPARIVVEGDPVAMANILSMLGWKVFGPDDAVVPPDQLEQIKAMRLNLGQDEAEGIPGAHEAADWFDSTQLDAEKPVDNVRRAFLAGYEAARRKSADGMNP